MTFRNGMIVVIINGFSNLEIERDSKIIIDYLNKKGST